ncbi:Bud-site selection protein [Paraphaeosphaeria sporulosa]|uniref:Bud-site selection protein n=1 Tax=Paraphaeosphaeria sporulosa TaxID=1460663 RepID=A0A177BXP5_9PLEO|nr:Bud-site selection protein [Paraphaeosphaeria sporulosa]OAG00123.1 Bud-site selection protein [Paraphaeosphaeria sporulosa]
MPKRKRAEPSGSKSPESTADPSLARRKKQCTQRIAAAQKPLVAALRIAAGLERQKHSRRKKTVQSNKDSKGLARIEAEYAHLKSLDLEKVADQHLRKTFAKVKTLRESGCMPESVGEVEKGSSDAASLNVKGRLFKVDAVRKVVDELIDELKEIVGATASSATAEGKEGAKSKKARRQEADEEAEVDGLAQEDGEDSDAFAAFDAFIAAPSSAEDDSEDSLSDGHRPPSEEDLASEGESEDEDENEDTSNADSVDGDDGIPAFHTFSNDEDSASDSDDLSIPLPKTKRKTADPKASADSKFLPTLSHPTYISGSESEASDIEVAPRKNRRGQKARQKIWEQKYKDQAKHIVKQERDRGWDAKRGAVAERGARNGRGGPPRGRGPEISGANELPLGPKKPKRDDAGMLHPSWLAAKAAKEKKMDVKPMGKKVVFD